MAPSRWKILGILLLVVVALASVESFSLWKPVGEPTTSLFSTSGVQSAVAGTTLQTSIGTTSISYPPTQWITISSVRSVSYYLSLFDSNGTQPYLRLGEELRRLPHLTNATAVATITYLALSATNPEVKEAFQLMMNGGTPSQSDYSYSVPTYNTELEILYWLACQNELKKDDTLALAIAMVNGIWITIGDAQVPQAVYNDTTQSLRYFRETNELQEQLGYYPLEDYPLEAKLALAWTGNESPAGFGENRPYRLFDYESKRLPLSGYLWDVVDVNTLRQMRQLMVSNGWISSNVDATVANLEYYFYFNLGTTVSTHWNYTNPARLGSKEGYITINGEKVLDHGFQNVHFELSYYLTHNMGIGSCLDEEAFIDAWSKSWGIATTGIWLNPKGEGVDAHNFVTYYESQSMTWRVYSGQLEAMQVDCFIYVYKMPVIQSNFLWTGALKENPNRWDGGMVHVIKNLSISQFDAAFSNGVPTAEMKQWLLYS